MTLGFHCTVHVYNNPRSIYINATYLYKIFIIMTLFTLNLWLCFETMCWKNSFHTYIFFLIWIFHLFSWDNYFVSLTTSCSNLCLHFELETLLLQDSLERFWYFHVYSNSTDVSKELNCCYLVATTRKKTM